MAGRSLPSRIEPVDILIRPFQNFARLQASSGLLLLLATVAALAWANSAFANAGVTLGGNFLATLVEPVTLGVIFGLVIGKPVGITVAVLLAVKTRIAALPSGVSLWQIHAVAWLGGIGFTLALFIAELAFSDESHLAQAKGGILFGSLIAGIAGSLILLRVTRRGDRTGEPE